MTTTIVTSPDRDDETPPAGRGRRASRFREVRTITRRSLVVAVRDPQALIPNLFVGLFFFLVNVGSFQKVAPHVLGQDVKTFQLPVAIMFAVTNISRAPQVVLDIERGLFDRLLVTPVRRSSLLAGMIAADAVIVVVLSMAIIALGLAWGVHFATGVGGMAVLVLLALGWAVAYCGFPYAIAFKTRSPDAVNAAGFMLFFPFAFLTTALLPVGSLAGWMQPVARANPVTYFLSGARGLIATGWDGTSLWHAALAIAAVAAVGLTLAARTLAGLIEGDDRQ
jgi:ABC-2 type transport system permease protein